MAVYYKATGIYGNVEPEDKKAFTLKEAQNLVGGYVTLINLGSSNLMEIMLLNEEGELRQLPINVRASEIAHRTVFGDVVRCKRKEFR